VIEAVSGVLGGSPAIRAVLEDAEAIANSDSKVLICGESGVGKEVLARLIHAHSRRRQRPMFTINCAGVSEGLLETEFFGHVRGSFTGADRDRQGFLEAADTGTVLLDEVGEMSLRMQGMLLRFLENGEIQRVGSDRPRTIVDVRIIAATRRDLLAQVQAREFREDLYYRLNIVYLLVPPLRERREDIRVIFEHFVTLFSRQAGVVPPQLTADAFEALEHHDWPGNVRELRNVAERVLLMRAGQRVTADNLPLASRRPLVAATAPARTPEAVAEECYRAIVDRGESFWTALYEPFMMRDITRESVRHLIFRGLQQTKGSYRLVAELFNLPTQDYKKFMNCLQKHDCVIPFQSFRVITHPSRPQPAPKPVKRTKAGP
jgi:transcriptional regulator with GAF, ATPase, and Fis domain